MNNEALAIETLQSTAISLEGDVSAAPASEITPIEIECFRLVGGGSSIIVLE